MYPSRLTVFVVSWLICGSPQVQAQRLTLRQLPAPFLGDAPRAQVPTHAADTRAAADATPDGLSMTPTQREQSRLFYLTVYQASENVPSGWTGDVSQDVPGTTAKAFKDATLLRIKYFRAMAGVPTVVTFSDVLSAKDQQAALMMSANGALSHNPPTTWIDYTADGAEAAGHSNLFLGSFGPASITGYIYDPGDNNAEVGHRRWILYPPETTMGTGDVDPPSTSSHYSANSLWVVDGASFNYAAPMRDGFVSWPPPGYLPNALAPTRWSLSYPDANFSAATVTMQSGGQPLSVILAAVENGYGDNTLVWTPGAPSTAAQPGADVTEHVVVSNVLINGVARSFTYDVTFFDPATPGTDTVLPVISGTAQVPVNAASAFTFNAVPNATGYQYSIQAVSSLTLLDNAENGPGDVTITPAGTDVLESGYGANDSTAYQLTSTPTEAVTLNPTILPAAGGTLQFASRLGYATTTETATVQLSTDDGISWHNLYTQTGTNSPESVFTTRTLDLTPYAGQSCRIRFQYSNNAGNYYPRNPGVGWMVDEIKVTGSQSLRVPTTRPVADGQTGFSITPPSSGQYALRVQPLFFGSYAADPGPLFRLAAGTGTLPPAPVVMSATASAQVGVAFSYSIIASNYPTSYDATGLPPGLGVETATGLISGTPTMAGSFNVMLVATNAGGSATANLALAVATAPAHALFFNGEVPLSNGVYYLAFPSGYYFGYYSYLSDPHYIFHFDLGYEYMFDANDGKAGAYFYDFKSNGFFYTSPAFPFPYLYDFSLNSVVYYYPDPNNAGHYNTNGFRFFYVFSTGQIIVK